MTYNKDLRKYIFVIFQQSDKNICAGFCSDSKFDDDQDGKITISTLPILLRKGFGIAVNDRDIFDLLAKFDITNETTKISFEKFIRMLQFAVRQGEKSQAPEYMKKLKHRCGPALKNIHQNDIKLLKKRIGGYLSSSMDETIK